MDEDEQKFCNCRGGKTGYILLLQEVHVLDSYLVERLIES